MDSSLPVQPFRRVIFNGQTFEGLFEENEEIETMFHAGDIMSDGSAAHVMRMINEFDTSVITSRGRHIGVRSIETE